jgi:hypothetical protein
MTVTELVEKLKSVKTKDTVVLFRDKNFETYELAGLFYGITDGVNVAPPQVGEEPNCVVAQMNKVAKPVTAKAEAKAE